MFYFQVCVEGMIPSGSGEGDTNMLITGPRKKKKIPARVEKHVKKLSKKERKHLVDVIQRKERKEKVKYYI